MAEISSETLENSADIDISENLAESLAESLNCVSRRFRTTIRVNLNFLHCFCCCEFQKTKNSKINILTANIFWAPRGQFHQIYDSVAFVTGPGGHANPAPLQNGSENV